MENLEEKIIRIRCVRCNKVLGEVPEGTTVIPGIAIKCTRCKTKHVYKIGK